MQSRHGSAGVYRWEFDKGKKSLAVAVQGPSIVDEAELLIRAAPFVCSSGHCISP